MIAPSRRYTGDMRYGLFAAALVLFLPAISAAQSLGTLGGDDSFTVSVTPQYPAPYSQATLSFVSSSLNLPNATMTVSIAGKETYRGNVQPVSVALGKAGSITKATITISSGGISQKQTVSIQPQDVALVVEPVSSAPPLYPGKPFVPLEGDSRVVAVANLRSASGKPLDPTTLSYLWTVDGAQIASASGIGKEAVLVASPLQYRSRNVSVVVTSQDGTLIGGDSTSLVPLAPSVRIYESDPLLGIRYGRTLSRDFAMRDAETTLFAAPFSLPTTSGEPSVQWFLNGAEAQTGPTITLRPAGSGRGNASLSLVASADGNTRATAELLLSFGAAAGFNFFGL